MDVSKNWVLWGWRSALGYCCLERSPTIIGSRPVTAQLKQGDDVVVAVRLIHKKTRKPVTKRGDHCKTHRHESRRDGEMTSSLTPVPSTEPGIYAFKTDLSMTGRWLLRIAAMVPG